MKYKYTISICDNIMKKTTENSFLANSEAINDSKYNEYQLENITRELAYICRSTDEIKFQSKHYKEE